jgi:hypothetical protein
MLKLMISVLLLNLCNSQDNTNPCKNNEDCIKLGNNYSCISVQSENNDLLYISQCIKGPICSGNTFGNCPNFTNWSNKYQLIKPECSFSIVENCNNLVTNNTVDCYNSKNNNKIYGIYKCVDANTIKVNYNTTNIAETTQIPNTSKLPSTEVSTTQLPDTNKPNINNKSSNKCLMINILCLVINFIIIISLF